MIACSHLPLVHGVSLGQFGPWPSPSRTFCMVADVNANRGAAHTTARPRDPLSALVSDGARTVSAIGAFRTMAGGGWPHSCLSPVRSVLLPLRLPVGRGTSRASNPLLVGGPNRSPRARPDDPVDPEPALLLEPTDASLGGLAEVPVDSNPADAPLEMQDVVASATELHLP